MRRRAFLISTLMLLTGCASVPAAPPAPVPNVYVIRHLHTPKGVTDPDLTAEGQVAAGVLAAWLSRDPPAVIFVSDTKRAKQTAAPTAKRFGVTPTVYDPRDSAALLTSVLAQQGTVLVVGHSNTVPDIVAGLGGERPAPLVHEDFGDVWRVYGPARTTVRAKLVPR